MFPTFEYVLRRLFKTGRDDVIFKRLCLGYNDWDTKRLIKRYQKSNRDARQELLKEQSDRLSASGGLPKYRGKDWHTLVVQALLEAIENNEISRRQRDKIFGHSDHEYKLYGPLGRYLKKNFDRVLDTHNRKDLPCGNPDFIARKKHWGRLPEIVAVDAKANISALHSFYNQAYMYYEGFDRVYLATTGWIALMESVSKLKGKLEHLRAGLIYVDVTSPKLSSRVSEAEGGCRNKETKKEILEATGL